MDLEKLIIKRNKLKNELDKLNDKIDLLTPRKISLHYNKEYDYKTKSLISIAEYYCPYCGEIPKKYCKKHKCGQMLDWSEFINDENKQGVGNDSRN